MLAIAVVVSALIGVLVFGILVNRRQMMWLIAELQVRGFGGGSGVCGGGLGIVELSVSLDRHPPVTRSSSTPVTAGD